MAQTRYTLAEWANVDMSAAQARRDAADSGVAKFALHRLNVELLTRHGIIDAATRKEMLGEDGFRHPDPAAKLAMAKIDPVERMVFGNQLRRRLESAGHLPSLLVRG